MAKDPAFLFYPNDWLGGTSIFTREEKGAYMDLLVAQFNHGKLTLENIRTILGSDFDRLWAKIQGKFKVKRNLYYNERLSNEIIKRQNYAESRRNNAKGQKAYAEHMPKHREDRNRNENEDRNDIKALEEKFDMAWNKYPKKDGKKVALKHFMASVKTEKDYDDLLRAIDKYKNEVNGRETRYIKNGSTFFNNWQDWIPEEKPQMKIVKHTKELFGELAEPQN